MAKGRQSLRMAAPAQSDGKILLDLAFLVFDVLTHDRVVFRTDIFSVIVRAFFLVT